MKKLLIAILSLVLINNVYASDAQLKMRIAGSGSDNRYFMCVSNVGCVSVLNGNKGKIYPMGQGEVNNIVVVDMGNRSMNPQNVPASCNVTVSKNQTVTVTGKIVKGSNQKVMLANLHCSVA